MRIASFNVENLFSRVRAMDLDDWGDGKGILEEYAKLNSLLQKTRYTAADKAAILKGLGRLGMEKTRESEWAILRENRGRLLRQPQGAPVEVVAKGRADWVGWIELKREAVNEIATQMTARVIKDVDADVLAVVEAEDRTALLRFDQQLLKLVHEHIMLIDGNDERGIDVGILSKKGYDVESIVSHVDDPAGPKRLFSRDCPEYTLRTKAGASLLVMICHLKSKGYGTQATSDAKRKAEATRVRKIYDQRRSEGVQHVAIVGDFNDTPDSAPLAPLLKSGSDLRDISTHPKFAGDGRPGTYGNGTASNKIDYILLSPALYSKVKGAGVWRKGVWGGTNGTLFPHYPDMKIAVHAASDHAALFADVDL